jgi:hypothetical protein
MAAACLLAVLFLQPASAEEPGEETAAGRRFCLRAEGGGVWGPYEYREGYRFRVESRRLRVVDPDDESFSLRLENTGRTYGPFRYVHEEEVGVGAGRYELITQGIDEVLAERAAERDRQKALRAEEEAKRAAQLEDDWDPSPQTGPSTPSLGEVSEALRLMGGVSDVSAGSMGTDTGAIVNKMPQGARLIGDILASRGFPEGLLQAGRQVGSTYYIANITARVARPLDLAALEAMLGKGTRTGSAVLGDPVWHCYGWIHFGVRGTKVTEVRLICGRVPRR